MLCVQQNPDGSLSVVSPQPVEISGCVLVVQSALEAGSNPFALSIDDAESIGSAILLTWAIAFGLRTMRNFLSDWSNTNE